MHTDWSQFFGRFHPLLVHFPIGFILFAALLSIVTIYKKNSLLGIAISLALLAGAISAGLSSLSGYFLSAAGGYNPETLSWHKWIGITVTILTFLVWFLQTNKRRDKRIARLTISNWLLMIAVVLITIGGHLGGNMTHGQGYLTRYMPGFLQTIFGSRKKTEVKKVLPVLDSVNVYTDIIQPLFNSKCISCHNKEKDKGGLDLTNIDSILKGGKSGNIIVVGNTEKSELIHRITLPPHSSKFMPADNRPPLTPIEIHFIKQWIATGADYKKNITASGADEKTRFLIASYLGIDEENNKEIRLPEVKPADSSIIKQLKDDKLIIRPLTSESNLLEASFVMLQGKPASEILPLLQKLSALKQQLYRLDVSNCGLANEAIVAIAALSSLNKLEIQKNNLSDESIEPLAALQQIEVLNIGQNNLTDKSLVILKKMPALKRLNLWQTKVTEEGVKELQAQARDIIVEK
ncbi:MAG: hypothetical protein JST09_18005 [Bacteroidetes bacterium]|nr:hypothetical protein [Bacteroidota bacterium]